MNVSNVCRIKLTFTITPQQRNYLLYNQSSVFDIIISGDLWRAKFYNFNGIPIDRSQVTIWLEAWLLGEV